MTTTASERQITAALEDKILIEIVNHLTTNAGPTHIGGHTFQVAYIEDALVLIEDTTGDLYEVQLDVVSVYRPEAEVDQNQLPLGGGTETGGNR